MEGWTVKRNGWCILLALVFFTAPAHGQERLRASWSGSTPSNAPVWVAVEKGFFKKHGVEVEMQQISASTIAAQALLAASWT